MLVEESPPPLLADLVAGSLGFMAMNR